MSTSLAVSEVRSVNVFSIDEERLKFRVIVGIDAGAGNAPPQKSARYVLDLPPLTSFGNSNHYNQCTINLDCFSASAETPVGNQQVGWSDGAGTGKVSALAISLDTPSSGTILNRQAVPAEVGVGTSSIGRFHQLVPLQLNLVGNTDGTIQSLIGGVDIGTGSYAWQGVGYGGAMLSANPFGRQIEINFKRPDINQLLFLAEVGFPGIDVGQYALQFTIVMVPNN